MSEVIGHFSFRALGGHLRHIVQISDHGPGAVRMSALCHGIQPWVRVDSSLTPEEWPAWKQRQADHHDYPPIEDFRKVTCERCKPIYERQRNRRNPR